MLLSEWSRDPQEVSRAFLHRLNSSDPQEAREAAGELKDAPPKVLLRLLWEKNHLRIGVEIRQMMYWTGILTCMMVMLVSASVWLPGWLRHGGSLFLALAGYGELAGAAIRLTWQASMITNAYTYPAAGVIFEALRATRDSSLVFLALEDMEPSNYKPALFQPSTEPHVSFCLAFEHLLPLLSGEQRQAITRRYHRTWSLLLGHSMVRRELKLEILTLFEEWGAAEHLRSVYNLYLNWTDTELRDLAKRCLYAIERREAETKQTQTLLRPAYTMPAGADTLLRPATPQTDSTDAEQLLRTAEG